MIVSIKIKFKRMLLFQTALLAAGLLLTAGQQPVAAAGEKLSTKIIDGKKNYGIYASLNKVNQKKGKKTKKSKKVWKFGRKMASTKEFKLAHVQSQSYKTANGRRYYYVYIDGRGVGYVNEKAFVRSKMSLVKSVSLVNDIVDSAGFNTDDAINYVTDKHGSVVDNGLIKKSIDRISEEKPGHWLVTYRYGKAYGKVPVTVRGNAEEGITKASVKPGKGGNVGKTWFPIELAFRGSYSAQFFPHTYWGTDKKGKKAAKLTTKFYEPNSLSLLAGSEETNVRTNVQGLDVYGQDMVTTNFYGGSRASLDNSRGHVILYHLNKVPTYALQYMPTQTLNFYAWKSYAANIKVSPYIKLGHGQSLGSTSRYIYELANWNRAKKPRSNELLQIDKKTMQVNRIWTFAVSNGSRKYNRYFLNADVIDDNTVVALFHNKSKQRYEFWKIVRKGNSFQAKETAAVSGNLISNSSQVQGFTYNVAHKCYYIAFNDYLFKISAKGNLENFYHFNTKREVEGLASYKSKIYIAMNKRAEVLDSNMTK